MGGVVRMQVQVVGRAVVGFKYREVFLIQMTVELVAGIEGKQQRVIGVVGVQDQHGTQIERMVARNGR